MRQLQQNSRAAQGCRGVWGGSVFHENDIPLVRLKERCDYLKTDPADSRLLGRDGRRSLRERVEAAGSWRMREGDGKPLSPREVEVLRLLGTGMTVKEISLQLHKSVSTISRQKGDAMLKLGLKGDAELFDYLRDGKI